MVANGYGEQKCHDALFLCLDFFVFMFLFIRLKF